MGTPVLSARQHLLLRAAYREGGSTRNVANRMDVPEASLLLEFEELQDLGVVKLPSCFYDEITPVEGGTVRFTTEGLRLATAPPPPALEALRQALMAKYPKPVAVRSIADAELLEDHHDALLFMAAVDDPGVIGTIQTWIGQELRRRTPGLGGPLAA